MMAISRRGAMLGAAGLAIAETGGSAAAVRPRDFLWGVATAAHQIEGNNVNSDYWLLEHLTNTGFPEPSGDACNSWERWRDDIALVAGLGLNAYRFSVEWARIEPEQGQFSAAVLDHYRRMCAACREAGIAPVVTFHHFTSPRWLAAAGGWENRATAEHFARYCDRTARALGDLIDWGCTLNEPNAQVNSFIVAGGKPWPREAEINAEACRVTGSAHFNSFFAGDGLKVRDVTLAAHARGRDAIKAAAPHIKVGMTLALQDLAAGPGGEALYRRVYDAARAAYYHAADADDFIGVQSYNRLTTGPAGYAPTPPEAAADAWARDSNPDVLAAVIREVHRDCRAPILVTENGINTTDDALRVRHLTATLAHLAAVRRTIPVLGYIHWSLLDNFEWGSGYRPRFGLYACDRTTFARTPKPSAAAYRALVAAAA